MLGPASSPCRNGRGRVWERPTTWMEWGERQQRPVSCSWLRPVTNVSCPWSHLLKSRDVPVNLFNLCSLCQRISLFLPGWASWILCEPDWEETWMSVNFQKDLSGRGYDSFENPGLTSLAFALSACAPSNHSWQPGDTGQLSDTCPAKWDGSYPWGGPHYAWRGTAQFGKEVMTKWKLGIILFICNGGSVGHFTSYTVWMWTDKLELCPSLC